MSVWKQSKDSIFVAGHRGCCGEHPENTMRAFQAALDAGVDQIETDVRVTKDGALVLIHDATVDRTTNGNGLVCEMTLEELQALDAGEGERVPLLTDLLELAKGYPMLSLDIELKEYPTEGREELAYSVCDRTLQLLEEYGFGDRCVINSFSGVLNDYVHKKYNGRYKQHVYFPLKYMKSLGEESPYTYAYCACAFGVNRGEVSVEEVLRFQEETGVRVWAGSYAKDEAGVDLAVAMGSELITCNNPAEVLAILRRRGLHQ